MCIGGLQPALPIDLQHVCVSIGHSVCPWCHCRISGHPARSNVICKCCIGVWGLIQCQHMVSIPMVRISECVVLQGACMIACRTDPYIALSSVLRTTTFAKKSPRRDSLTSLPAFPTSTVVCHGASPRHRLTWLRFLQYMHIPDREKCNWLRERIEMSEPVRQATDPKTSACTSVFISLCPLSVALAATASGVETSMERSDLTRSESRNQHPMNGFP